MKLLGMFEVHSDITAIPADEGSASGEVTVGSGEELLVFKADHQADGSLGDETWIVYLDRSGSQLLGLPLSEATPVWKKLSGGTTGIIGIPGVLGASIDESASFYFADGKLRVCDTKFGNASFATTSGSSSLWFGFIDRTFGGGALTVDSWHVLPAVLQAPIGETFAGIKMADGTDNSVANTFSSGNTGPDLAAGTFGISVDFKRDKGDGSIQLIGRKLYATYTYDNSQETLPVPIMTFEKANIESLAPAPTEASLGYEAKIQRAVEYGDTTIYLGHFDSATSTYTPVHNQTGVDTRLSWESAGTITIEDDTEQTQTLNYANISGNDTVDISSAAQTTTTLTVSTSSAHNFVVGDTVLIAGTSEAKWDKAHNVAGVTDSDTITITMPDSETITEVTSGTINLNGSKLTGVTGWVDSGFCSIGYTIDSIILTDGGTGYTAAPTVNFHGYGGASDNNGDPTTAATATASLTGSSVTSIEITGYGDGYQTVPEISFSPSNGETIAEGDRAVAIASITGKLSTETLCANKGTSSQQSSWTASDIANGAVATYDPPGEIDELDEKLGFRILLGFHPKDYASASNWGKTIVSPEYGGARITHVNFYTNKYEDEAGTVPKRGETDYAFVGSFDLSNGFIKDDGVFNAWASDLTQTDQKYSYSTYFGSTFVDNYQARTGVFPDTKSLDLRWKTATVINRRVYAGNVHMQDNTGTYRHYPDRVMKSIPNAFDVFPEYDSLDVVVDDGDEIVLLETFGGRLLQFKKESLYVIDVTNEPEYLAGTYRYRGVPSRASVAKADTGIVFANKHGVYMFNGEGIQQLLKGKIDSTWASFYDISNPPIVSFNPTNSLVIINKAGSATFYVYDMLTKSWVEGDGTRSSTTAEKTKTINVDSEIVQAVKQTDNTVAFMKWTNDFPSGKSITDEYKYESKEFDFGNPSQDSQIYNIKVTYKTNKDNSTAVNGAFSLNYNTGAGIQSKALTGTMNGTNNEWVNVELKPSGGNLTCKSASVVFTSTASQELDYGFEINDITIIYRNKTVK
tara:strand:+ start:23 stop:3109 length:3087 start_codon:yes stop_codon:yes gene_type:complete